MYGSLPKFIEGSKYPVWSGMLQNAWYLLTNSLKTPNLSKGSSATEISTQTHSLTFTKTFHQPIDLLRNEDTTLASFSTSCSLQPWFYSGLASYIIINENIRKSKSSSIKSESPIDSRHSTRKSSSRPGHPLSSPSSCDRNLLSKSHHGLT